MSTITAHSLDARYATYCEWHNRVWYLRHIERFRNPLPTCSTDPKDRLTKAMWNSLVQLIIDDEQAIVFIQRDMFSDLTMLVYRYYDEVYPGARPDPELTVWVHQSMLPQPLRGKHGTFVKNRGLFDDVWRHMSPLYTSDEMAKRRQRFALPPAHKKDHFEY